MDPTVGDEEAVSAQVSGKEEFQLYQSNYDFKIAESDASVSSKVQKFSVLLLP